MSIGVKRCFTGFPSLGHTPNTAGTFRKKFRKYSGKSPEKLSERFLEFLSRVRLGPPKPYNSRHLRLPEHFQNSLPPSTAGDALFFQKWFRRGPLRAGHGIPSSTGVSLIHTGLQVLRRKRLIWVLYEKGLENRKDEVKLPPAQCRPNRELRGWPRRGCREGCQEQPEKGA